MGPNDESFKLKNAEINPYQIPDESLLEELKNDKEAWENKNGKMYKSVNDKTGCMFDTNAIEKMKEKCNELEYKKNYKRPPI